MKVKIKVILKSLSLFDINRNLHNKLNFDSAFIFNDTLGRDFLDMIALKSINSSQ